MAWTTACYDLLPHGIADRLGTSPKEPAMHAYINVFVALLVVRSHRRKPLVDGGRDWDNRHYARTAQN